uniref:Uncharacterized protein n=1 Tax=Lactuca sativa TaxID=4236 RepID=A0A9R1WC79_LACSA|nr:hypothetical protein LSAT_V11C200077200 [Lactuca sativa]
MVGFTGHSVWPIGKILLTFTLEDYRAPYPYNILLGRTGLWKLQAVSSKVHGLLKFHTEEGAATIQNTTPRRTWGLRPAFVRPQPHREGPKA